MAPATERCIERPKCAPNSEIQLWGKHLNAFDGTTTNRKDYVEHPLEARPMPGQPRVAEPIPFNGQSTYSAEYPVHQLPEREMHRGTVYQPAPAAFDGATTYKTAFVPHEVERSPVNPRLQQRVSLPFEGTSCYRSEYPAHPLPERTMAGGGQYRPNNVPFDGSSTYKDNFVPHQIEARPAPQPLGVRESLPFDGSTTYGDYFRPYPIQAPASYAQTQYRPNPAKFEGTTENAEKYRAWAIDPANHAGRGPPPMRPSLPFDGTTTSREMFQGWQLPPRRPALGVQMLGDIAYVLVPANASLPATGRQIFTTVHDNQTEMCVLVLEGDAAQASRCNVLGHFDLKGLPPGPKGSAKVEISFHITSDGVFNATAMDLNTHRQEQWLREGYLEAHVHYPQA